MNELSLSEAQTAVVHTWGQGLAVIAGAGAGKTSTLVEKCIELLKRRPDACFAAVSFTDRSAADIAQKLREMDVCLERNWVMTIHGLCWAMTRSHPSAAGLDGEEKLMNQFQAHAVWEEALGLLWSDECPEAARTDFDLLLTQESSASVFKLLERVRRLRSFGAVDKLREGNDPFAVALNRLSDFVVQRYDNLKRRRGVLDFDDLEIGALRALKHKEVCKYYQNKFDLLLVDEFQDTNPTQAEIVWAIARRDLSNLCVVGDPKQSIYRFRDADVSVFEERSALLPVHVNLNINYRSRPGIINLVNSSCRELFVSAGMQYQDLEAHRDEECDAESVQVCEVQTPAELACFIKGEVARGVVLSDMAILLRKIRGNEAWIKGLGAEGIPLAIGSGGFFWEDPRSRELTAFLKWWDNPANALSGAVFLRAPWVGIADSKIDEWVRQDKTFVDAFFGSRHRLSERLKVFRNQAVRPGELLAALLDDEVVCAEAGLHLLGLWHRAEELSGSGLDFHQVVEELARAMSESRRERELPPAKNIGQLLVLTIHGAKGLEFKNVILLDFPEKPESSPDAPQLFWDRRMGVFLSKRDESGSRDHSDPNERKWREEEKRKNLAESIRLFYVALTRARDRLTIMLPQTGGAPKEDLDVYTRDFWRGWIMRSEFKGGKRQSLIGKKSTEIIRADSKSELREKIQTPLGLHQIELKRVRHSVTEWSLLARCPRAYEWTYIRPVRVAQAVAETDGDTETESMELGSQVHACLERGDWDELSGLVAPRVVEWAKSSEIMRGESREQGREIYTELSFEVPIDGEVLVGSIDRLISARGEDGEREYSVVDFKVTKSASSELELINSYSTQLSLYCEALQLLEQGAPPHRVRAFIVDISPGGVQTIEVPAAKSKSGKYFAGCSRKIINGASGAPAPSRLCYVCQFKTVCIR